MVQSAVQPTQPPSARLCLQRLWDPDRAQPPGHEGALFERVQLPGPLLQGERPFLVGGHVLAGGRGERSVSPILSSERVCWQP